MVSKICNLIPSNPPQCVLWVSFPVCGIKEFSFFIFYKVFALKKIKKRKKEVEDQVYVTVNGMMASRLWNTFPGIPISLYNISIKRKGSEGWGDRSLTFKTSSFNLPCPITLCGRSCLGVPFFIFIQSKWPPW